MMKHGRKGKPKMHYFRVADNDTQLTWRSAKGSQRSVPLRNVTQVGPHTQVQASCDGFGSQSTAEQISGTGLVKNSPSKWPKSMVSVEGLENQCS